MIKNGSIEYLSEQVEELFWNMLEKDKIIHQKYDKLLRLHNSLIEGNSGLNEKYNEEYIYKLVDENEFLRTELAQMMGKKSVIGKPTNKTAKRIEVLERKVIALESQKSKKGKSHI